MNATSKGKLIPVVSSCDDEAKCSQMKQGHHCQRRLGAATDLGGVDHAIDVSVESAARLDIRGHVTHEQVAKASSCVLS